MSNGGKELQAKAKVVKTQLTKLFEVVGISPAQTRAVLIEIRDECDEMIKALPEEPYQRQREQVDKYRTVQKSGTGGGTRTPVVGFGDRRSSR